MQYETFKCKMTNDTSIEKNTCTINFCIMRWHFAVFQALCSNINHFKLKAYRFKAICPLGYDSRRAWSIAVLREQAFSTLIIWRFEINYEHSVTTKTKTIIARATSTKPSPLTINETHFCGALSSSYFTNSTAAASTASSMTQAFQS